MRNYTITKKVIQSRISATEVERNNKIREQYKSGLYSYNKLARIYHISPQRISQIIKNEEEEKKNDAI